MIPRKRPFLGSNPDYSKALYLDPPSHDACVWLIIAELMRRHMGAPGPLKVKFGLIGGQLGMVDFGPKGLRAQEGLELKMPKVYSDEMILNVIQPAIEMIGAVLEEPAHMPFYLPDVEDYCEYDYHISGLVDAVRAGAEIPRWRSTEQARATVARVVEGRPVVITLRESLHYQTERNSNIEAWLKFAEYAKGKGHDVLFVRDTANARAEFPWAHFPVAAWDARVRLALYERALVNMMVCTGPFVWCSFSEAPYLLFKQLVPELPRWQHGQPEGWREQDHIEFGEQWPWARANQKMTWADDTYDNICEAFDRFVAEHGA